MKKIALTVTAATIAIASTAASAWGWGPYYGYAPYGYGVPAAPAVEITDEQRQAIADQQASFIENMLNAQKQAAEHFQAVQQQAAQQQAEHFANMQKTGVYPLDVMRARGDMVHAQMEAEHNARIQALDAQRDAFFAHMPTMPGFANDDYRAQRDADYDERLKALEAEREARAKEMDARKEAFMKAAEERRKAREEAFKTRLDERNANVEADKGA